MIAQQKLQPHFNHFISSLKPNLNAIAFTLMSQFIRAISTDHFHLNQWNIESLGNCDWSVSTIWQPVDRIPRKFRLDVSQCRMRRNTPGRSGDRGISQESSFQMGFGRRRFRKGGFRSSSSLVMPLNTMINKRLNFCETTNTIVRSIPWKKIFQAAGKLILHGDLTLRFLYYL